MNAPWLRLTPADTDIDVQIRVHRIGDTLVEDVLCQGDLVEPEQLLAFICAASRCNLITKH